MIIFKTNFTGFSLLVTHKGKMGLLLFCLTHIIVFALLFFYIETSIYVFYVA
jgi:hypothetical protein